MWIDPQLIPLHGAQLALQLEALHVQQVHSLRGLRGDHGWYCSGVCSLRVAAPLPFMRRAPPGLARMCAAPPAPGGGAFASRIFLASLQEHLDTLGNAVASPRCSIATMEHAFPPDHSSPASTAGRPARDVKTTKRVFVVFVIYLFVSACLLLLLF